MTSDKQNIICLVLLVSSISSIITTDSTRDSRSIETSTKFSSKEIIYDTRNVQENDEETLRMESAGGGKNKIQDNDDEDRKTLSQQVAEGKYGLIQKEIFSKPVKSFGVISYLGNPEVPKDNSRNLGGLNADDIWLAEDHLLILKGGIFPAHNSKTNVNWPPIDNYKAPRRQVKIPLHPKVPPPFPVQLQDNGPIEIIGPNGTTQTIPENINTAYPAEGYAPGTGPFFPTENDAISPNSKSGNSSKGNGPISFPFPPSQQKISPLPPFIASLPPNAVYLPPPGNQTDMYDEDDPSIYYPPPYSFYYSKDNATHINPGPLVPGIILPPPPDFFGIFEPKSKNKDTQKKVNKITIPVSTTTPKSTSFKTTTGIYTTQIPPTLETTTIYKPQVNYQSIKPIYVPDNEDIPEKIQFNIPTDIITDEPDKTTVTTPPSTSVILYTTTSLPVRKIKPVTNKNYQYYTTEKEKTIPYYNVNSGTPLKKAKSYTKPTTIPTTTTPTPTPTYNDYSEPYYINDVLQNLNPIYTPPKKQFSGRVRVTTTAIPLKAFFTTNSEIESNSVTSDPIAYYQQRQNNLATRQSPKFKPQSQFYYYEEKPKTTTDQNSYIYYSTPVKQTTYTSKPTYYEQSNQQNGGITRPLYIRPTSNKNLQYQSTLKPETISSQIIRLQQEIQSYLTSPKYKIENKQTTSKPIYEYSFQAADYIQKTSSNVDNNDQFRPIVGFNQVYSTTQKPPIQQHYETQTLKPIQHYETQTLKPIDNYDQNYDYDIVTNPSPIQTITNQRNSYRKVPIYVKPTENPLNNAYYTKQDESYLDEITKQYFTVFGQKIEGNGRHPVVTTPIQHIISTTPLPPLYSSNGNKKPLNIIKPENIEVNFGDNSQTSPDDIYPKKISLERDILINYRNPRPPINPDSELISNIKTQRPIISLQSDIAINDKYPRPPINPNAELITPVNVNPNRGGVISRPIINNQRQPTYNYRNPHAESLEEYDDEYNRPNNAQLIRNSYVQQHPFRTKNRYREYNSSPQRNIKVGEGQPGQFISFPLPGNGAHFYFLTPQVTSVLAQQKQDINNNNNNNNNGYVYPEPNQRLRRSRIRQQRSEQSFTNNAKR